MNWKKWDENTWINMSNGHLLIIYIEREVRAKDGSAYYRMEKDIYESRTFKTKDAAINAGRSSTKGCLDIFYEVEEVK